MSNKIHNTAIIEDGAIIGNDVEIGAFCVIAPVESLDDKKSTILDLEKIYVKTSGDIITFVN